MSGNFEWGWILIYLEHFIHVICVIILITSMTTLVTWRFSNEVFLLMMFDPFVLGNTITFKYYNFPLSFFQRCNIRNFNLYVTKKFWSCRSNFKYSTRKPYTEWNYYVASVAILLHLSIKIYVTRTLMQNNLPSLSLSTGGYMILSLLTYRQVILIGWGAVFGGIIT